MELSSVDASRPSQDQVAYTDSICSEHPKVFTPSKLSKQTRETNGVPSPSYTEISDFFCVSPTLVSPLNLPTNKICLENW